MALEYERIEVLSKPPVTTIVLDDPESGNALGDLLRQELVQALLSAQEDDSVRVVVIRGRGEEFCRGLPEGEIAGLRDEGVRFERLRPLLDEGRRLVTLLDEFPKPVVAALNGPARAEGTALALACDLRIAHTSTTLSVDFAADGLAPAWGASARLTRLAGEGRALDLLWTGRVLDAAGSRAFGLVERVTADLAGEVEAVTDTLARRDPNVLHLTRLAVESSHDCDLSSSLDLEAEIQHRCWGTGRGPARH